MAKDKTTKAAPDNGTGSEPQTSSPVSGINLGELLDDKGLAEAVSKMVLNEEAPQEADSPAPGEGKTEPNEPASEPAASADGSEADEASTDTTDLSQPENTEEEADADDGTISDGVKKRFAKLTAKRREAEEQLRQQQAEVNRLREELEGLKTERRPPPVSTESNPFSGLTRQEDVDKEIAQARKVRRWCEENPDGAVVTDPSGKETEYTAEQIRKIRLNAVDALEEHLPRQLAYIRESAKWNQTAEQMFPWWKNRSSQQYQTAEQLLAQAPELKRFPNYKLFIGDYILGVAYREAQAKLATNRKPVPKATVQPTKPSAQPPPTDKAKVVAQQAKENFRKTGTEQDLQQVVLTNFL